MSNWAESKLLCWKQLPCFLIYTSRHFTPGAHQTESFSVQGSPCPKLPQQSGRYFWYQCIVFWSQCLSSVLQAIIKIDLISGSWGFNNYCIQEHKSLISWKCSNHSEWIVAKMWAGRQVQRRYTSWWTFTGHHNFLHKIHHNVVDDIAILLINLFICLKTRDERLNLFFKNRILRLYMRTNPHIFGYSDTCACSICIMAKPIQIVNSIK